LTSQLDADIFRQLALFVSVTISPST